MNFDILRQLSRKTDSKIVLLIMDGLGGLPNAQGQTELDIANTPELDSLAKQSDLGLLYPVHRAITPGSGPGHLGLFGYDPFEYMIGRGVLASLGVNFDLQPSDVAARINFCTLDDDGVITDRRAGRIPTEKCEELVGMLQDIEIDGVKCFVVPVRDYRAALIMRGPDLHGHLADTDPQSTGKKPLTVEALSPEASSTATLANKFIEEARSRIKDQSPANGLLLRGFDRYDPIPQWEDIFKIKGASIAVYPMYKGVSRMVGMDILDTGPEIEDEIDVLEKNFDKYDLFYIHVKKTDSCGEDGDFVGKAKVIEEVSRIIPRIGALGPEVIAVTGDHSTPATYKAHSWHPVPLLIHSSHVRADQHCTFSESCCARGSLGHLRGPELLPLLLANAGKLAKYGA